MDSNAEVKKLEEDFANLGVLFVSKLWSEECVPYHNEGGDENVTVSVTVFTAENADGTVSTTAAVKFTTQEG